MIQNVTKQHIFELILNLLEEKININEVILVGSHALLNEGLYRHDISQSDIDLLIVKNSEYINLKKLSEKYNINYALDVNNNHRTSILDYGTLSITNIKTDVTFDLKLIKNFAALNLHNSDLYPLTNYKGINIYVAAAKYVLSEKIKLLCKYYSQMNSKKDYINFFKHSHDIINIMINYQDSILNCNIDFNKLSDTSSNSSMIQDEIDEVHEINENNDGIAPIFENPAMGRTPVAGTEAFPLPQEEPSISNGLENKFSDNSYDSPISYQKLSRGIYKTDDKKRKIENSYTFASESNSLKKLWVEYNDHQLNRSVFSSTSIDQITRNTNNEKENSSE